MKKLFFYIFLGVSACELIAEYFSIQWLHFFSKPLILVALGIYYIVSVEKEDRSKAVLAAIFFSFAGDSLLLFEKFNPSFFMGGLAAFLTAHLFYVLAYRQHRREENEDKLQGIQKLRFSFPIILAGTGLVVVLYPTLGELKIPVLIYTLVIVVMALNALFRYGRTSRKSFFLVFSGVLFFMISDSLLAINKFMTPISHALFLIMLTYIAAQYLIIEGLIRHVDSNK